MNDWALSRLGVVIACRTRSSWLRYRLDEAVFANGKIRSRRMYLHRLIVELHPKTVQGRLQEILPLFGIQSAPGRLKIVNGVAIVGQDKAAVLASRINLKRVVMAIYAGCDLTLLVTSCWV